MSNEETLKQELHSRFGLAEDKLRVQRERRVFAEVPRERLLEIIQSVRNDLGFDSLCTMTGQDEGEQLSLMYHLCHPNGVVLTLKLFTPKANPVVSTVSQLFPSAVLYEREAKDLLGFEFEGLTTEGSRYPLVDDWPEGQYPLRKDWKLEMLEGMACEHKM